MARRHTAEEERQRNKNFTLIGVHVTDAEAEIGSKVLLWLLAIAWCALMLFIIIASILG